MPFVSAKSYRFEKKSMVNLRRPSRLTRNSGFGMKNFVLIIAAIVTLVFWAFQRLFAGNSSNWILIAAIALALWAFGWAIWDVISNWRNVNRVKKE